MTARAPSVLGRAVLALFLLAGFYVLALAIVAILVYLPWAEWTYAGRLDFRILIFCGGGAALIVWSLLPRWDRFVPPGPRIDLAQHPKLGALIERVAAATGQQPPRDVYAVAQMNAFVAQRGGIIGIGSRRVMGIGLPLLGRLTVAQLAGVLAHEFGHYHGGDTALGPLVYKTRAAIARTLENLSGRGILQAPFEWYGNLFLRITHAVSRAQEYAADALAARIVGSGPLAEGLRALPGSAAAFDGYWRTEYEPLLRSGYRAPFQRGFEAFVGAAEVAAAAETVTAQELADPKPNPYDTHPPLKDRLAALGEGAAAPGWDDAAPASSLLGDPAPLERELLAAIVGPNTASKLQPIEWADVPRYVWVPGWRRLVYEQRQRLQAVTPALLSRLTPRREGLAVALQFAARPEVATPWHVRDASSVFGAALAVALIRRGWTLEGGPGQPVELSLGADRVRPFDAWEMIATEKLSQSAWQELLERHNLAEVDLAAVGSAEAAHPV